jgi:hypothetical protein
MPACAARGRNVRHGIYRETGKPTFKGGACPDRMTTPEGPSWPWATGAAAGATGPGCPEKVFRDEAGEPYRTAAIAHIRGANPGSARYKKMTNDQRWSITNLMLLCGPHHWIVDQDELKYTAEKLQDWKTRHEAEFGQGAADQAGFVTTYRKHVCELHGYHEPPDFERSARVPAADLYVPGQQIREVPGPGRPVPARPGTATRLTVADLPRLTDRTVLLGDPGGGKTTAARMMMRSCAGDPAARTPFLVSVGAYAAEDPLGCSIAEYIERHIPATYECRPPDGLVGRLLRAGEALVIFDGLDEFTAHPATPAASGISPA